MLTFHVILWNIINGKIDLKDKIRLCFRALYFAPSTVQLESIFTENGMKHVTQENPRHYYRCALPYLSTSLNNADKLGYIRQHCEVLNTLKPDIRKALYADRVMFADFSESGHPLSFKGGYFNQFEKEGEITFYLQDLESNEIIYTMTGVLTHNGFIVGGLQGKKNIDKIRYFTKKLHGMRPHNLLFFCVAEVIRAFGGKVIYGITNEYHIYKGSAKTSDRIQFDYNHFWGDFTHQLHDDIWFELPCCYPRKPIEDVITKKRGMYRKRYVMLDDFSQKIIQRTQGYLQK